VSDPLVDFQEQLAQVRNSGMQRRNVAPAPVNVYAQPEPPNPYDVNTPESEGGGANQFERGLNVGVTDFTSGMRNLYGVGQVALGNESGARETFKQAQADMDRANVAGPRVASYKDVHGVGDAADYLAGLAGSSVPMLATTLVGGGLGGAVAKGLARRGATAVAERLGAAAAERALASGATEEAAATAATAAKDEALPALAKAAADRLKTAGTVGHFAGAAAAALPSTAADVSAGALDEGSPDALPTRAAKALTGAAVNAALMSAPAGRLVERIGAAPAVGELAQKLLPRVVKEGLTQGTLMGTVGAASTAVTLATHKAINDAAPSLLSNQAFDQYINSFVGGAILGGVTGGGVEGLKGVVDPRPQIAARLARFNERAGQELPAKEPAKPTEPGDDFKTNLNAAKTHADLDLDALTQPITTPLRYPRDNPVQFKDPVQNILAAHIPTDAPVWEHPQQLRPLIKSAAKMFTVDQNLSAHDYVNVNILREFVGSPTIDKWVGLGPEYAKRSDLLKTTDVPDAPIAMRQVEGAATDDTPKRQALVNAVTEAQPNTREYGVAKRALQTDLLGGAGRFVENRSTPAARDAFSAKASSPEYVETSSVGVKTKAGDVIQRRQLLSLSNLTNRYIGEHPGDPKAALMHALADLKIARVPIKPESITPGKFWTAQPDDPVRLTPNDVKQLRAQQATDFAARRPVRPSPIEQRAEAGLAQRQAADVAAKEPRGAAAPSAFAFPPEQGTSFDTLHSTGELGREPHGVARELPPQTDRTSTLGVVRDVKFNPDGTVKVREHDPLSTKATDEDVKGTEREVEARYKNMIEARGDKITKETSARLTKDKLKQEVAKLTLERDQGTLDKAPNDRKLKTTKAFLRAVDLARSTLPEDHPWRGAIGSGRTSTTVEKLAPKPVSTTERKATTHLSRRVKMASEDKAAMKHAAELGVERNLVKPEPAVPAKVEQAKAGAMEEAKAGAVAKTGGLPGREGAETVKGQAAIEGKRTTLARGAATPGEKAMPEKGKATIEHYDKDLEVGVKAIAEGERTSVRTRQLDNETRVANKVLGKLGVKQSVTVTSAAPGESSHYDAGVIKLAPSLKGVERLSVLAHELGHHIIEHELGENFEKATPKLRSELIKAHQEWVEKNNRPGRNVSDVLASRKPLARGEALKERSSGQKVRDLSPEHADYLFNDMHEFVADHIARALEAHDTYRGVVAEYFKGLAAKLKFMYDSIFGTKAGKQYAAHPTVEKWVKSLFDRNTNDVRKALRQGVPARLARSITKTAAFAMQSGSKVSAKDYKAWTQFYRYVLTSTQRRILERAITQRRVVTNKFRELFSKDAAIMERLSDPKREGAMSTYLGYKLWASGKLKLGPQSTEPALALKTLLFRVAGIAGNNDVALGILRDAQTGRAARIRARGNKYDPLKGNHQVEDIRNQKVQQSFTAAQKIARDYIVKPLRKFAGVGEAVHYSGLPAMRDLERRFKLHTGEVGRERGYIPDKIANTSRYVTRGNDALEGLSDRDKIAVLGLLQTGTVPTPKASGMSARNVRVHAAAEKLRTLFDDMHDYARRNGVPIPKTANYFPIVPNSTRVKARSAEFKAIFNQPKFEAAMRDKLNDKKSTLDQLAQKMVDVAGKAADSRRITEYDPTTTPGMRAANPRVMDFIYKLGDQDDIARFARFQVKDARDVITPYVRQIVARSEYTRYFGAPNKPGEAGWRIKTLMREAERQGATPAELKYMHDIVASSLGTYGINGSPLLNKYAPWLGAKLNTEGGKLAMDWGLAYQNARLMPLVLLSSVGDPMGIFTRSGGDFTGMWRSLKDGVKAVSGKASGQELRDLSKQLAFAEDYIVDDTMRTGMASGDLSRGARKFNDTLFKLNGMTSFTRYLRYVALAAAQHHMLKHADILRKTPGNGESLRYLRELHPDLKPADVRRDAAGRVKVLSDAELKKATPAQREADERVKAGILRFADESILRTDPTQHPIYLNDPAFALVGQYKRFAYAFNDQILDRMVHEFHYGNVMKPILPAVGYVGLAAMGEMLRGFAQYGPAGNPTVQAMDPLEYTEFLTQRAGMLGPRAQLGLDTIEGHNYASMGHMDDFGPTFQQAHDIFKTAEGERTLGSTLKESLPAASLIRHTPFGIGATP
jgi:hypothetical protein